LRTYSAAMAEHPTRLTRRGATRLAAALPFALAAHRVAAQGAVWTMATEYPADTVSGDGIAFFAARLAEESGRRLTILPSHDAAFGLKSAEIVGAVRDGRLAAGCAFGGTLGDMDPLFLLSSLPFVATSAEEARRLLDKAVGLYARRFAREGQRLLYAAPWPPSGLWAKKPIRAPSDLVALRVRVYDATGVEVFGAARADAVSLSFADTSPRVASGAIEAVLSSGDGGAGRKLWERLPHFTEIGYAVPLSFATLAVPLLDKLPDNLKEAVDRAAAATQANGWESLAKRLEENYARMRANGVTITPASDVTPELRGMLAKGALGAIEKWKRDAGPEAAKLL
jgi:TRAP-type C4-dicarboxylate transport system substrate-binding protein